MGSEVPEGEGLDVMVAELARRLSDKKLNYALARCATEIRSSVSDGRRFAPRLVLADILEKAGMVNGEDATVAEATAAFDEAVLIAERYASPDGNGGWVLRARGSVDAECTRVPALADGDELYATCGGSGRFVIRKANGDRMAHDCACKQREHPPEVPERLSDTVRRIGGWGKLKGIPGDRFTFVRKEFLQDYARWAKVENHKRMGRSSEMRQLAPSEALRGLLS